jgi:hypothetical protein
MGVKRWRKTTEDICMVLYSEGDAGKKKKNPRINVKTPLRMLAPPVQS